MTDLVETATPQLAIIASGGPVNAASAASLVETAAVTTARAALSDALFDIIAVFAPRRAVAGSEPTIALTVNRQGSPVADASVFVQFTTVHRGSRRAVTVTVPVTTSADGTATVTLPKSASGSKGARTVIESFTNEGRAMGAKGSVSLISTRKRMRWN
jgi:hypothetical protein